MKTGGPCGIDLQLSDIEGDVLPPSVVETSNGTERPVESHTRASTKNQRFLHTMRAIQGSLIVASIVQIFMGFSKVWGLFSRPLGMSPVVGLLGFGLFDRGFPAVGNCVEIGIPMNLIVIASQDTDIGRLVNLQRNHPSTQVRQIVKQLVSKWKCIVDNWVKHNSTGAQPSDPTRTKTIDESDGHSPQQNLAKTTQIAHHQASDFNRSPLSNNHKTERTKEQHYGCREACFCRKKGFMTTTKKHKMSTAGYKVASRLAIATPPPAYVLSRGIGWQGLGI